MRISFIFFSFVFCITIFGQENFHSQNGEKIINEKIEKYNNSDTLKYGSPLDDYEMLIIDGRIIIKNPDKNNFGKGGFSVYKLTNKITGNLIKIEFNQTKHLYKDEDESIYLNSEFQRINIFFNEENIPDFAKILINQYTNEKVISSQIYYLNLTDRNDYFINQTSEKLTKQIFEIIENYK